MSRLELERIGKKPGMECFDYNNRLPGVYVERDPRSGFVKLCGESSSSTDLPPSSICLISRFVGGLTKPLSLFFTGLLCD
jgi:hypothetical protein